MRTVFPKFYDSPWTRWAVVGIAGLGGLHFALSLALWGRHILSTPEWAGELLADAWPAAAFFALATLALIAALFRCRWSLLVLLAFLLSSAGAFAYDVANERWQARVTIATEEYWKKGGKQYFYWTWWWYGSPNKKDFFPTRVRNL